MSWPFRVMVVTGLFGLGWDGLKMMPSWVSPKATSVPIGTRWFCACVSPLVLVPHNNVPGLQDTIPLSLVELPGDCRVRIVDTCSPGGCQALEDEVGAGVWLEAE